MNRRDLLRDLIILILIYILRRIVGCVDYVYVVIVVRIDIIVEVVISIDVVVDTTVGQIIKIIRVALNSKIIGPRINIAPIMSLLFW